MAIKTFSVGEVLTASDTNTYLANAGLVYVTSATVGSAVSSVTVSNCFTSTYDRFMIQMSGTAFSVSAGAVYMSLSGITTASYYGSIVYQLATSGTVNGANVATGTAFYVGLSGNQSTLLTIDGINPAGSPGKTATTRFSSYDNTASYGGTGSIWSTSSTNATGFTIFPGSGTMTGGTITVYGYRKA